MSTESCKDCYLKIQQLEKEINEIKNRIEYKDCPTCYGNGEISTPSGDFDYECRNCKGSGKIKRTDW